MSPPSASTATRLSRISTFCSIAAPVSAKDTARSWFRRIRIKKKDLAGRKIAIPGTLTTSYLALKLFEPNVETVTMPFDKILDAVQAKEVEAGLLIHEGQLLFSQIGLHRVVDLGQWWQETDRLAASAGRQRDSPQPRSRNGLSKSRA